MKYLMEKFQMLYYEKSYLKLFLYLIATLLITVLAITLTYYAAMYISYFIAERFEAIIAIVGAYLMLYLLLKDKQKKRQMELLNSTMRMTVAQQSAEKALCDSNYATVRQCLFSILAENAEILNLQKPEKLSQLDSPSRAILKGNVHMCQFIVVKSGNVNPGKIKEMLQIRIEQKLSAFEFPGIAQTRFIYNGIAYPILYIDEVRDNGAYVQVDIAWVNESYCKLLDARAQARMQNLQPPNNDFHDNDF